MNFIMNFRMERDYDETPVKKMKNQASNGAMCVVSNAHNALLQFEFMRVKLGRLPAETRFGKLVNLEIHSRASASASLPPTVCMCVRLSVSTLRIAKVLFCSCGRLRI
jgi:hypothetical protein